MVWTLVAGFLVMFKQAGFALAETGLTRAKNATHTMMMNFMVYTLGMTGYWIGAMAGVLVCVSVFFVEKTLKVDDPVGAVSVHDTCGAWGVLSLGLFADGTYGDAINGVAGTVRGLFYGDAGQLLAQGLDIPEMGARAYPDFSLIPSHSGSETPPSGGTPRGEPLTVKEPQIA